MILFLCGCSWQGNKEHGQSPSWNCHSGSVHAAVQSTGWPDRCVGGVWWEETSSGAAWGAGMWGGNTSCTRCIYGSWFLAVYGRLEEDCFMSEGTVLSAYISKLFTYSLIDCPISYRCNPLRTIPNNVYILLVPLSLGSPSLMHNSEAVAWLL